MQKAILLFILVSTIAIKPASAQPGRELSASGFCREGKMHSLQQLAKTTIADPAEDDYDMKYVKFNISLNNQDATISGNVTTRARVVAASMAVYVFELSDQLSIDSLIFNGQPMAVTTSGFVRTVTLPAPLAQNMPFIARVHYHGLPTGIPGFFGPGLNNDQSPSWGNDVTYTLGEAYEARGWWPTKQSLTDKIDSADIWITVPDSLKAGSNGLLKAVTPMPNNEARYEWSTRYPIDYYLLSATVASYVDYSYYVHFQNGDSMLVQNYVYDNPLTLPFFQDRIDSVGLMLLYFSKLYGRYPFWQEKYGHCMAPIGGGMEHQTMTTLGNFSTTLSVHEMGHQWFGDNVTCGSWKDIWLNEGFAAYTEYLFKEHFWGQAKADAHMRDIDTSVREELFGSVYVDDTTNEGRIFDGRLTYNKGAAALHALRFVLDNDTTFFQSFRNYQQLFAKKTALTSDLKDVMGQTSGLVLDTFFNQWVYGEGYPIYTATWNQLNNKVFVQLQQTTSMPVSIPLFYTPIELKLTSPLGDTTVRVYNNQASQFFSFTWSNPVQDVIIDPNFWLVNDNLGVTKDTSLVDTAALGVHEQQGLSSVKIYPNPAKDAWHIAHLGSPSMLQLTDINGKLIWNTETDHDSEVPAAGLSAGFYFLRIKSQSGSAAYRLMKE